MLSKIITAVQGKIKYNQWMNTALTALQNKEILKSIKLKWILHNYLIEDACLIGKIHFIIFKHS